MFDIYRHFMCLLFFLIVNDCISFVSLQESLAQAVEEEMQKVYQSELGLEPIPFTVPGHAIDDKDVSIVCFMYLGFT